MNRFEGKYAVVTGGCRGIGEAIVRRLVQEGAKGVAIFEWDAQTAQKTASDIDPSGERVLVFPCDVSKEEQVEIAVQKTLETFGTIDILINNAGITRDAIFHKMTHEQWDTVLNVNLNGTYHTCKYIYPLMRQKQYGRIVNITSISAWGNVGQANYAASKGAIISLTKTLAREGGFKNVTVNAIAPGYINTEMYRAVPEDIITEHKKQIPLGRLGKPEEIASVAAFLASDDASFVSSQTIVVSGGSM